MLRARFYLFFLSLASLALIPIAKVQASNASLYFSPDNGSYIAGDSFTIEVDVSSLDEAMNSASGEINFPTNIINVDSVTKAGSIFDLWVRDPVFSNSTGKITFTAVKFNPGYLGPKGSIFTITFRGVMAGTANVNFASGRVLANDGNGTAMDVVLGSGQYIIGPSTIKPLAPSISSPTHPDQNKWYCNNDPILRWAHNQNSDATSFLLDKNSNTNPDDQGEGNMTSMTYQDIEEGISYFHAKLRNANGGWGAAGHFKLQTDTEKPDYFDVNQAPETSADGRVKFNFSSVDKTSGIDYFNFQIDNQCPAQLRSGNSGAFETSPLLGGEHVLIATVYDRSCNFISKTIRFTKEGEIVKGPPERPPPIFITGGGGGTSTEKIIEKIFTPLTVFAPGTSKTIIQIINRGYAVLYDGANLWLSILFLLVILVIILLILFIYRSHQYHKLKKEHEKLLTGRQ